MSKSIVEAARTRHQLSRRRQLTSWFSLGESHIAIISTKVIETDSEVIIEHALHGTPHPNIAEWMITSQRRVDQALSVCRGGAWEDAWHEGGLLSLISDIWARPLLRCRAKPEVATCLVEAFDNSCLRVRARIATASTEFPRLARSVREICRVPAVLAA